MLTLKGVRKRALAALLAILAIAALTVIASREAHDARVAAQVSAFSGSFQEKLAHHLADRVAIAEVLRDQFESGDLEDPEDVAAYGVAYHIEVPDVLRLYWLSPEARAAHPAWPGSTRAPMEPVAPDPAEPRSAGVEGNSGDGPGPASDYLVPQGGGVVTSFTAVRSAGMVVGHVVLEMQADLIIDHIVQSEAQDWFQLRITEDAAAIYGNATGPLAPRFAQQSDIDIDGLGWEMVVIPTESMVAAAGSPIDDYILLVGVALSLAVGGLVNGAINSRETLVESEQRFALAMQGASDGLFDVDYEGGGVFYSPRWFEMLGYTPTELPSEFETFAWLLHPDDAARVLKSPEEIYRLDGDIVETEFRMQHKDGSWVVILSRAYIVRRGGRLARVVGTHVDISELRRQQSELERAATTDPLTGLRNRRGLAGFVARQADGMAPPARLAIFHLDLDKFKSINDMNGHEAGDTVLRVTAGRLAAHPTAFDVVARVGGDEFLLAIATPADDAAILAMATQLVEDVSRPIRCFGKDLRVGASIGIAFAGRSAVGLVENAAANADIALYTAKSVGRNRCAIFEDGMRSAAVRAVQVSSEIHAGLERDEFRPLFQPQVDVRTNRILGFEALARWHHPERGLVGAAEFVSFAENAHLLDAIDDRIFAHACAVIPRLSIPGAPAPTISVNVSTARLESVGLVERLIEATDRAGVPRDRIRIEILESTLLSERCGNISRNIFELSEAGFRLELDDFGTGHTAIASLRNYPISRIKIDRSLICGVERDRTLQTLSGTIVDLGAKLGIEVLAEGVETREELRYLAGIGCTQVQGYLVARPMPIEALADWIETWTWTADPLSGPAPEPLRQLPEQRFTLRR